MIEIAKAMLAVQKAIKPALKGAENPFYHSKYATLESVWDACREALQDNGISVIQGGEVVDGKPCMKTILLHESGESIESVYLMAPTKDDPQAMGSAITYMRRYSLASMVGVVTTDDDGEAAMSRDTKDVNVSKQTQSAPRGTRADLMGRYKEAAGIMKKEFGEAALADIEIPYLTMCGVEQVNDLKDEQIETLLDGKYKDYWREKKGGE